MPHGRIAFSSSASRGELRFARAPRRASTRPRVIWRLVASHRVVKSCVLAPRLARAHFVRHRMRPVAVSMNPAFSSSASRGELRFARAPRRASTRPRSLRAPQNPPRRASTRPRSLRSPQNAPRCASTRPRSLRALQNAPRRASTRPPLTSCATECAPSHLDSPAALVRSSRLNGCALRL